MGEDNEEVESEPGGLFGPATTEEGVMNLVILPQLGDGATLIGKKRVVRGSLLA